MAESKGKSDRDGPAAAPRQKPDRAADGRRGGADRGRKRRPDADPVPESGGPAGPEPTRYGDWEVGGRCTDF